MKEEDRKIGDMFNDPKRSNAILKLAAWEYNGVLSKESFAEFSKETQESVMILNDYLI